MTERWKEIDCEVCGHDWDVPWEAVECPLGHPISAETEASANYHLETGAYVVRPHDLGPK